MQKFLTLLWSTIAICFPLFSVISKFFRRFFESFQEYLRRRHKSWRRPFLCNPIYHFFQVTATIPCCLLRCFYVPAAVFFHLPPPPSTVSNSSASGSMAFFTSSLCYWSGLLPPPGRSLDEGAGYSAVPSDIYFWHIPGKTRRRRASSES